MKYKPYNLKDVVKASEQEKFTVVSTFAGGGGSSTGYRLAGGKILCVNEFVQEAINTYKENYPNTPILPDDIKKLNAEDFNKYGDIDIFDGSPPCSAFSVSGAMVQGSHSKGWGQTKTYSDGKKVENIEDLFFEFLRIAKDLKPKVIVAENVKGLTIGEAKNYLFKIVNTFEEIGYDVSYKVLNSVHYGVGQTRQRTIFIAVREDVTEAIGLTFMNIQSLFPQESNEVVTLEDCLTGIEVDRKEADTLIEKFEGTSHHETWLDMPDDPKKVETGGDYHPKGHFFNMKKCSRFKPSPTITAHAGAMHWHEPRTFTIKEVKRIMSLPDDFKLTGSFNKQAERCGRMVPPLMMKAIAESIYEKVLKPYYKKNPKELGGRKDGLEPTRYNDWEMKGRCIDF
jgi:DNA (cytosine-5)-methyltransferase 1|tara:strand:- start:2 stop:1192 length:1191 start_codon:yes stop_codon:yes gene_type:complete